MGKSFLAGLIVAAVLTGGAACRTGQGGKLIQGGKEYQNQTQSKQRVTLSDGSAVILAPGAKVDLGGEFDSGKKELSLDGEAWFDIVKGPVTLSTRDMVVAVLWAGRFHAEAFRAKPGEEIDLLEGRIRVMKSYHSDTDNEPEVLEAGEMVMINRDIDLMEKEKLNPAELEKLKRAW